MAVKEYKSFYKELQIICDGQYINFQNGEYKTDNVAFQKAIEADEHFGIQIIDVTKKVGEEPEKVGEEPEKEDESPKPKRGNPNFGKKAN